MIQPQLDLLLGYVAPKVDDIVKAKQEYFAQTGGEVHEDDRCFESRLQGFFNWYLFDRRQNGETPAQRFLQEKGADLKAQDKDVLMGFTQTRLSLYEYRGRKGFFLRRPKRGQVRVRDIVAGKDFDVTERRQMHGLEIGDIFEARLVPVGGTWHFSTSFTYHPREQKPVILREIKRRKKQGPVDVCTLAWELERMALQAERFRNVNIDAIYNFENPFLGPRKTAHG
ncbi:MAG TPA: hypothetical protein VG496_16970 [Myxococcales bacterium]|nr:hypothetical protein [Myxococcales bacterium]